VSFYQELFARLRVVALAIGVHVLMAALVVLGTMSWEPFRKPKPVGLTIEAVIVDTGEIKKQRDAAKQAEEMEDRRKRRAEEMEQQKKREQELKKKRDLEAAEKRKRDLEEKRKRDAQDKLQKLRMENERKLEEEREKQQRELDQITRQREEAEKKRKLDAEKLKQLENDRKKKDLEEQQKLQREAAAKRKADEEAREFRAGQTATKSDNYQAAIQAFVTQNWLRPPTAQPGLRCTLKIVQIPGGEVISAAISGKCNGDEATRRSILAAVERGGTLPYRGFEDVFAREIDFIFIYDGD
jgi:colicin import membrane protein